MLSRLTRRHKANEVSHLVVELKAPKVKIDAQEIAQIEGYAASVSADERFRNVKVNWTFWVISDDLGPIGEFRVLDESGLILKKPTLSIYIKTWAQVLDENRARMQFFQERLEFQADKGASLEHLQQHYAKYLEGVIEDSAAELAPQADAENEIEST